MRLSELKTGEKGVIVKVTGHGGFRKRIVEMGFIKGKTVEVLLNAPLKDPIKYKIMGYEISLRRQEASMIEIISEEDAKKHETDSPSTSATEQPICEEVMVDMAKGQRKTINVALVGNPNCGKTSLFNQASGAHEHVGNYSGVTVDMKEGYFDFQGYRFRIIDLPGTYSLSTYTPEEMYVRKHIIDETPDVIINVVDASNLERNLYLTTQLIDMNVRMVCALNMYDECEERGDKLNYHTLGKLFGVPMIPTVFKTGEGIDMLFHIIINIYEGGDFLDEQGNINPEVAKDLQEWHKKYVHDTKVEHHEEDYAHGNKPKEKVYRHIHLNHGRHIEKAIESVQKLLKQVPSIRCKYSTRYLAIKLLEMDKDVTRIVESLPNATEIIQMRDTAAAEIKTNTGEDSETAIMNAKFGFINGALHESEFMEGKEKSTFYTTQIIDKFITNKYLGFPLFFLIMYFTFDITFSWGQYPTDWVNAAMGFLTEQISGLMSEGPLKHMIVDGIMGGLGAVVVFLPQILILYCLVSIMEDTGYMARAAFIMDRLMHKIGLHGKSFIPMFMGFGCNVPAIVATRTIESRRSRLITVLILPLVSCSARIPIYVLITGAFFAPQYRSAIMIGLYLIGIAMALMVSKVFSKWLIKGEDTPFVMELPPYRFPTGKAVARHTWEKAKQYLKKIGGVILVASIVVWALGYYPRMSKMEQAEKQLAMVEQKMEQSSTKDKTLLEEHQMWQDSIAMMNIQQQEQSFIGRFGKSIEPLFTPLGFNWKLDVAILTGAGAKEIVASTIGVLYSDKDVQLDGENMTDESSKILRLKMEADGITPLVAICFLLFILLYFPCVAAISAVKGETGSWKWAAFVVAYTTTLAWIVSALVYQVGSLLGF